MDVRTAVQVTVATEAWRPLFFAINYLNLQIKWRSGRPSNPWPLEVYDIKMDFKPKNGELES